MFCPPAKPMRGLSLYYTFVGKSACVRPISDVCLSSTGDPGHFFYFRKVLHIFEIVVHDNFHGYMA
jgi:hypothetical protein